MTDGMQIEFTSPGKPRVEATLYLWGDNLLIETITQLTGLQPTNSYVKGHRISAGVNSRECRTGLWSISTRKHVREDRAEAHVGFLLPLLGKLDKENLGIRQARIFLYVDAESCSNSSWESELSPEQIKQISAFGCSVSFTVVWSESSSPSDN